MVVAILGLIAGIVAVNLVGQWRETETKTARLDLQRVEEAVELYRFKYGRYPEVSEGLTALLDPPHGGESLLRRKEVPRDPWGTPYVYERDGGRFVLSSMGPDRAPNTPDDIRL